jgi:hypothetical protein
MANSPPVASAGVASGVVSFADSKSSRNGEEAYQQDKY